MTTLRTVLGDLDAAEFGYIQSHEHVFVDSRPFVPRQAVLDGERITTASAAEVGYYPLRLTAMNLDNDLLDDLDLAVHELTVFREAGGTAIIDPTSIGLGRLPALLAEAASAAGVHVVLGTGFYLGSFQDQVTRELPIAELERIMATELLTGIDGGQIRAGFIGEVGLGWPMDPFELRSLVAAAHVQAKLGVAVQVHPGRSPAAPAEVVDVFTQAGGDPSRLIICHLDRTLAKDDYPALLELANTGCFLEIDLFGRESSHYAYGDFDMPNDAQRVAMIQALVADGFEDQLLIGQDIATKVHLSSYGGEGYAHILDRVLPLMRRKGLSEDLFTKLTRSNPLRAFAWPVG